VRGAIFDMLGAEVPGARVLDLYCGSGSLGLESLSRGAADVVFVDRSPISLSCVRQNVNELDFDGQAKTLKRNLPKQLNPRLGDGFTIVFSDPPYAQQRVLELAERLLVITASTAVWVHESASKEEAWSVDRLGWLVSKTKIYGDTKLTFLEKSQP